VHRLKFERFAPAEVSLRRALPFRARFSAMPTELAMLTEPQEERA
jgi:hypothetical protein